MSEMSLTGIVVGQIDAGKKALPVFSRTALAIQEMIERAEYDPEAVEDLISSDPALAVSVLRHANSSFFGSIERVTSVRSAIVRLGVQRVAELVILTAQKQQYDLKDAKLQALSDQLWRHAVGAAVGAQWLTNNVDRGDLAHEAFLAGLLHDIGKLLLLRVMDGLAESKGAIFKPSEAFVLELLEDLHCREGHQLMIHWSIPEIYSEVVRKHHDERCDESDRLLAAVRLADNACNRLGIGIRGKLEIELSETAEATSLGVSEDQLSQLLVMLDDAMVLAN